MPPTGKRGEVLKAQGTRRQKRQHQAVTEGNPIKPGDQRTVEQAVHLRGTGVKARLDGRVLSIPLLVVLGVRRDGQKVLLAVKNMGGETEAAWRHVLEDLLGRGLKAPELLIVDGGKGLEAALASLWSDIPVQPCTVHKERNLLAHAPKALHDEVKADYTDMMYAENAEQVRKKRKAFLAKWRLRCRGVADSLEEAGERLFTFLRYPPQQWKSLRTTNAIERLHGEFKRRVKTQCALPNAETAAMLFWALMASGQITMRRVGGWQTLDQAPDKSRACQLSQSVFTLRQARLTASLPTLPPNRPASARRTRRVLVPARYVLAIIASARLVSRL